VQADESAFNATNDTKKYLHISVKRIQGGPKVRRQTATTHEGGLGESFEVGNPCPETHRYAPVSTFLERMNVRLATSHSSGKRARSGMRFSFVSFHAHTVCLCSSVVPHWPKLVWYASGRGFKPADTSILFCCGSFSFLVKVYFISFTSRC